MATNPMQRKSRISFLMGVLVTLIISALVIALLLLQLKNYKDKEAEERANSVKVWVLSQDVISGQVITTDMLKQQVVNKNYVPSNAIGDTSILSNYSLEDKEGNTVATENKKLYLVNKNTNNRQELKQDDDTGNYYVETRGEKTYVELAEVPIVAKVDMYKNSVVTIDMVAKSNEKTTDDLRKQEYNMIILPSQLQTGEYIDVRLALPTGQDYIVVSKKQVEIPQVNGVDSEDTIWMKLTEGEIITMNNAIVDAYRMLGAKLYITTYTEAGAQKAAEPTYVATYEVMELIEKNPNIVQTAKNELLNRYNTNAGTVRNNGIDNVIRNNGAEGEENLKTQIQESITNSKENRKQYLDSLAGDY